MARVLFRRENSDFPSALVVNWTVGVFRASAVDRILVEWELLYSPGDRFLAWVRPITPPPGNYLAGGKMNLFDGGHEFSSEMA